MSNKNKIYSSRLIRAVNRIKAYKLIILFMLVFFLPQIVTAQFEREVIKIGTSGLELGDKIFITSDGKKIAYRASGVLSIMEKINCEWIGTRTNNTSVFGTFGTMGLSDDGYTLVVGSPEAKSLNPIPVAQRSNAGQVAVVDRRNGSRNFLFNGEITDQGVGANVSISTNGKIIAFDYGYTFLPHYKVPDNRYDYKNDYSRGVTKVFELVDDDWIQLGGDFMGDSMADGHGNFYSHKHSDLSNDGSTIVISYPSRSNLSGDKLGYIRVFRYYNNKWNQLGQTILAEKNEELDGYETLGSFVTISGDGNVIATTSGSSVKMFELKNNSWIKVGQKINDDKFKQNSPRLAISYDGSVVAIGEPYSRIPNTIGGGYLTSGDLRVFRNINNEWTKVIDRIDGETDGDKLGYSVALSDDGRKVFYSAPGYSNNRGKITVLNLNHVIDPVIKCDSYTWTNGVTYTESNYADLDTFTDVDGCDSIVTLNLTITKVNADVTVVDELTLRAQAVDSGTTYKWLNCADLKPIPGETNATFTATSSGEYAVEVTFNNCVKKSECFTISSKADINVLKSSYKIQLFPNPTSDKLILSLEGIERADISLTDIHGKVILHKLGLFDKDFISLSNLESGIYFVKVKTSEFSKEIRVIKQ
jgi:hypothetical protein